MQTAYAGYVPSSRGARPIQGRTSAEEPGMHRFQHLADGCDDNRGRDRLTTEPGDDKLRRGVSDRRASGLKR